MTYTYKGYTIARYTRKDWVVKNPNGAGFLVHEMTLKAAKAAIDSLTK